MPSLPSDFLTEIAHKYELSPEQEEVFVALYSRNDHNLNNAADTVHITSARFRNRMTGVYEKFRIGGDSSGKSYRLQVFLMQEYQKAGAALPTVADLNITALVQAARSRIRPLIQEQCGTMRVLDMEQPIALTGGQGIYTNVNILERLTGRRRMELLDLLQQCDREDFDRFGLNSITERQVPGLEAALRYPKLMVLGKPGAGKTTFLKYLAMQCITGNFLADHVPIFVTLKQFAETKGEPDLLDYLKLEQITLILNAGKALILLDGLDEVREEDTRRVIQQIEQCATQFLDNHFVITCRIAAKEYIFGSFTEVEVADFDDAQIQIFAHNWFRAKQDLNRADLFWQKLKENRRIKELATSPLLLTLLCWIFGEKGDLPKKRHKLYQEAMDLLLQYWDKTRLVERDRAYKNLSLKQRKNLLSKIALDQFEKQEYFFEPEAIEKLIEDFLEELGDGNIDPESDSRAILQSIESHHGLLIARAKGIYSFSHLTFHEYFAAREIVECRDLEVLQQFVKNVVEKHWREVFLLVLEMLPEERADELVHLIMKQIDSLLREDEKLQQFLTWVQEKSASVKASYKAAAVRAFYFALDLDRYLTQPFDFERCYARPLERNIDPTFGDGDPYYCLDDHDYNLAAAQSQLSRGFAFIFVASMSLYKIIQSNNIGSALKLQVEALREDLPTESVEWETRKTWWQANGGAWTEQLRAVMIEYRNIGHDWQFSEEQKKLLKQYYDANLLLVNCLNSGYVNREVRAEIEETLLLPMSEIEKRKIK